jgi:hypothetical protein
MGYNDQPEPEAALLCNISCYPFTIQLVDSLVG